MAEKEGGGGSGWLGFIAGIALLTVVAVGVVAFTGGFERQQTADLELNVPDINIDAPHIDLPAPPPAPELPPSAAAETPAP